MAKQDVRRKNVYLWMRELLEIGRLSEDTLVVKFLRSSGRHRYDDTFDFFNQ